VWSCEGGHTDFPARNEVEFDIMMHIKNTQNLGRVSIERLVSGMGLTNIFEYLSKKYPDRVAPHVKKAIESGVDMNKIITENALAKKCDICVETLQIWISLYGAEAGNLALKTLPTGGLYVAGGIATKVMWAIFGKHALISASRLI
jgi:glucokinase